jgi:NAD(P)-dependent dehydrogenase (short-subunit alcohol dehydrogenase family)
MTEVRLDDRVAVITGAGGGLGREHALLFASRGAAVVVNDLGGALDGTGSSAGAAQRVVDEITALGGRAVADTGSVTDEAQAKQMVQTAIDAFGRIDIVVNNAGILRDKSFSKMTGDLVDSVIAVHLKGAFNITLAAWEHFREQDYGRIVSTSSAAGLFGNFGQANYGAAKMGLVGLTKVLAQEGARNNILANAIAPLAKTRMTEEVIGGSFAERIQPKLVSPLVAYLASEDCTTTGEIYNVGGGRISRVFIANTPGFLRKDGELTIEDVRDHWDDINAEEGYSIFRSSTDDIKSLAKALKG